MAKPTNLKKKKAMYQECMKSSQALFDLPKTGGGERQTMLIPLAVDERERSSVKL